MRGRGVSLVPHTKNPYKGERGQLSNIGPSKIILRDRSRDAKKPQSLPHRHVASEKGKETHTQA